MRQIIRDFLFEQGIIEVPYDELYDQNRYIRYNDTHVRLKRAVRPVALIDPVNTDIPQYFDGNRIIAGDECEIDQDLQINGACQFISAGIVDRVDQILSTGVMEAGVADRAIAIDYTIIARTPTTQVMVNQTVDLVLTADQDGIIGLTHGALWTNDNGAMAVAANYQLPMWMFTGDQINTTITNVQADDVLTQDVWYRQVH